MISNRVLGFIMIKKTIITKNHFFIYLLWL